MPPATAFVAHASVSFLLFQHLQKRDEETAAAAQPLTSKAGPSGPAVSAHIEDEEEKGREKAREAAEDKVNTHPHNAQAA